MQRKPYGSWMRPRGGDGSGRDAGEGAQPGGGGRGAGVRAGEHHRLGEGLVGTADREQGECGDGEGGGQEPAQFVEGERGLAEGEGVAADQGEGVVVVEGDGGGGPAVCPTVPGVFAGQREAGLGEGGQVAGADGAVFVDDGVGAGVQRVEEGGDDGGVEAGAARQQLIGAYGEHGADLAGGQRVADRAGVAAQQPQSVVGVGGPDVLRTVGADAGAAAVDPAGGGEAAGGLPGFLGAGEGLGVGGRGVGGALREGGDVRRCADRCRRV